MVYSRMLNIVPCLYSRTLFIHSKCNSLYLLTPNSQSIPSTPSPLATPSLFSMSLSLFCFIKVHNTFCHPQKKSWNPWQSPHFSPSPQTQASPRLHSVFNFHINTHLCFHKLLSEPLVWSVDAGPLPPHPPWQPQVCSLCL